MTEKTFGMSRLGNLWTVTAGPESLGVVICIYLAEAPAQSLADALNATIETHHAVNHAEALWAVNGAEGPRA
jgi:dihydrodipicolinate reductase